MAAPARERIAPVIEFAAIRSSARLAPAYRIGGKAIVSTAAARECFIAGALVSEGAVRGMKAMAADAWFAVAKRKRDVVDHGLLVLVQTSSGAGIGEGACSVTRATARSACRSSQIGPPASTSATLATAAAKVSSGCLELAIASLVEESPALGSVDDQSDHGTLAYRSD